MTSCGIVRTHTCGNDEKKEKDSVEDMKETHISFDARGA